MHVGVSEIAKIVGGEIVAGAAAGDAVATGVSTDSRTLQPGDVFVALRGERFDGHDFVEAAAAAGAVAAVVERPVSAPVLQVVVPDTLVALGKLAGWWRGQLSATVLAVTGSAGKTTTKSMLAAILERVAPTVSTRGTENNEIGVPLTLLRVRDERFCVLELGARGLGHVAYLAAIARPTIGVVTNIGRAHIGLFGTVEKVAEAKGELIEALPPEGVAVLNADDPMTDRLRARARCRVVTFGFGAADFAAEEIDLWEEGAVFRLRCPAGSAQVRLELPGRHNVANALAAAAAAWAAGAPMEAIVSGLESFEGEPMRAQVVRLADGTTLINDAYNASPTSVRAALEMVADFGGRKVFVFGDMLELGDHAGDAHREVGRLAKEAGVAVLIAVGDMAAMAADEAERAGIEVVRVSSAAAAIPLVLKMVRPGDTVLLKASRLVGLERVAEALEADRGRG